MPIEIKLKPEEKPKTVCNHPPLVALKVAEFTGSLSKDDKSRVDRNGCDFGDILFYVDSGWGQFALINASRGKYLAHGNKPDEILVVRAYDVQSIVLTYDGNPAPAK